MSERTSTVVAWLKRGWLIFATFQSIIGIASMTDSLIVWANWIKRIIAIYQSIVYPIYEFALGWVGPIPWFIADAITLFLLLIISLNVGTITTANTTWLGLYFRLQRVLSDLGSDLQKWANSSQFSLNDSPNNDGHYFIVWRWFFAKKFLALFRASLHHTTFAVVKKSDEGVIKNIDFSDSKLMKYLKEIEAYWDSIRITRPEYEYIPQRQRMFIKLKVREKGISPESEIKNIRNLLPESPKPFFAWTIDPEIDQEVIFESSGPALEFTLNYKLLLAQALRRAFKYFGIITIVFLLMVAVNQLYSGQ